VQSSRPWHGDGGCEAIGEEWRQIRRVESRQVEIAVLLGMLPLMQNLIFYRAGTRKVARSLANST